ncbi:MAG: galactokinase [Acidobacteriaceae bacterium]
MPLISDTASHPDTSPTGRPIQCVAPARVNLLGEHTDYTGGLVLPMAIPFATHATITPRTDDLYSFTSELFPDPIAFDRNDRSPARGIWADYPIGVLRQLQQRNIHPPAFDLHVDGNVPFAAGLSSSASVEVASTMAMLAFTGASLSIEEIALLSQRAENDYVHSPCGIMDQFVITAAKAGHALLLNTRSLTYEHIPMNTGDLAATQIVVCNSMVKHSVATGEYGVRRRELEEGQAVLRSTFPGLLDLGDATIDQLNQCEQSMSHEAFLRCRHVVTENARVRSARECMFAGDPTSLGRLMLQAHVSYRDDFAASCEEVDFLVDTATHLPGCFGARLTGGGFGGCTVNLVQRSQSEAFAAALKSAYKQQFNIAAEIYLCDAVDGAWLRNQPARILANEKPAP